MLRIQINFIQVSTSHYSNAMLNQKNMQKDLKKGLTKPETKPNLTFM